jgi:8-oxo-dGTP pyrophosphatase MutT (NUDIX family)
VTDELESLNAGAPTQPRPAASVMLLRPGRAGSPAGLEVLLGRRTSAARFMPNVWVFPGGALDELPAEGEASEREHRTAALRELEEEVSVTLPGPDALIPFSRWITPVQVKVRFDTRFYVAEAPPASAPKPDGEEIVDVAWMAPGDALRRHRAGDLELVFPTIKHLEALSAYPSVPDALAAARAVTVEPVLPKVLAPEGGEPHVVLPGEPGYESA